MAWISFRDVFLDIVNRHAPFRKMRFSSHLPVWMTRECLAEIRQRDILDSKLKKSNSLFDLTKSKRQRNLVTNMKSNLKKMYYSNAIDQSRGDGRKLWKVLKTLFRNCDSKSSFTEIDGATESFDIANKFNDFFCDIGPALAADIPDSLLDLDYTPPVGLNFDLSEVSVEVVKKIFSGMSSAKATGMTMFL